MLENIGIVSSANVKLDGLTVVTGKNNSGKTTAGRTLYALISAVENLQQNALADKIAYAKNTINNLFSNFLFPTRFQIKNQIINYREISSLKELLVGLEKLALMAKDSPEELFEWTTTQKLPNDLIAKWEKEVRKNFAKQQDDIIKRLKYLQNTILKDPELIEYVNKRIERKLNVEFFNQISPLAAKPHGKSMCQLKKGDKIFFDVTIDSTDKKSQQYYDCPFENVIFIDDGAVVDELTQNLNRHSSLPPRRFLQTNNKDFLESLLIDSHKEDLMQKLLVMQNTITGELAVEEQATAVMDKIREAISFGVEWKDGRFVSSDLKIDLRNLAQGAKAFLVIKMLLENGTLRKDSILILDEPETRLHPEWQLLFAEVIVLLIKEMGCSVLLTTHSPDFVMALDVSSMEHGIREKTNFYISKKQDDGLVSFDKVDDKAEGVIMDKVYHHLSENIIKLTEKRAKLINAEQNDY